MNREFVNTYMQEKNIPSGYLKAWYNFESGIATGSAGLIYNQVYTTGNHFFDPANYDGNLKSGVMAGISIGNDTELTSTTAYASDFSSGRDSWGSGVSVTDPVTGSGQVLKKGCVGSGYHFTRRYSLGMTIGKKYNITGKVFIDPLASNIQKVLIYHMDGWYGLFVDKPSTAQWVEFSLDFEAKGDYMTLYAHNGSGISFTAGSNDDFYIKDFVIKETTSPFSGNFDHNEMVQISDDVNYNNWTVFLDVNITNQQNLTGQSKILLSSMKNSGDTSGFYVGLNGYNKPFVRYCSTDGEQYIHTLSKEASNRDLISVSFHSEGKNLTINKHSPKEDYYESFVTKELTPSLTWTLGGFKEYLNDSAPGNHIRQFDGTMNHFMLFSPSLKGRKEQEFADFLFISDYEKSQVKQRQISSTVNSTGASITQGVVGQGVVGYEKTLSHTIDGVEVYKNAEVIGDIYGDVITYTTTPETIYSYESYVSNEIKTFDNTISQNFFNKKIQFIKNKDNFTLPASGSLYVDSTRHLISKTSSSKYEVRASVDANKNLNKIANWNGLSGSFVLKSGISGKYLNLYRNGLLQRSGTLEEVNSTNTEGTGFADYTLLDFKYIYSNDRYDKSDFLTYEECTLPNIVGGYEDGEDAFYMHNGNQGSSFLINAATYLDGRDMFIGGTKLIYGIDYVYFSSTIAAVYTAGLNKGVLSWVQSFDTNSNYNSVGNSENGDFKYHITTDKNLMDEIVWVSGVRQQRDVDYIKTANFSVLNNARINKYGEGGENYQGTWGGSLAGSVPNGISDTTYNPFDKYQENDSIIYNGKTGFFNS
tara:strand:- start:45553 stop:48000 length:2448 start_codon:yes stop_codon:yes gene_type:complete